MTRKKRTTRGKKNLKNLPAHTLEKRLIDLFSKQVSTRFDAKTIINKLKIANSKDSVQHCLEKLVEKGKLETTRTGKFKWNKNAKRAPKTKRYSDSQVTTGIVDATKTGSAYIVSDDEKLDKDIFVPAHKLASALNGDKVEVRWYLSRKGKPEGEVTEILQRKTDHFIGTVILAKKFAFLVTDNPNMQMDIVLDPKKLPKEVEDNGKAVVKITKWHTDNKSNPEGEITTYFGTEGGNDIEMKSILIQKGFNLTFPPEVLKENAEIDTEISAKEIARRRDMREITTFTIDPETAKDFDDALSIQVLENGNYEIGVHIADVTHYVTPDSELDKEAARRTTSVYLVDRVLPMLPEKLSNGVCSLRPNEEKLTFSAVFELDHKGNVLNEWFGKTVIYSDRRFTYEEAQERLESGEGDYAEELNTLNKFAHQLRRKRFKAGAINFESPEVRFKLGEDGTPLEVYLKVRQDAHMLVEDFMLLANRRVGALMDGLHEQLGFKWPMVYRIHDEPDMDKVDNFVVFAGQMGYPMTINTPDQVKKSFGGMLSKSEGKPEHDILQQLAIRTMAKAVYSSDNIGHYGLGFATYSHFTSPIRRYADVLAHRILFDYLQENNKRMNPNKLDELCKHISKKERDAMDAERESTKYKQAEFLENHTNRIFEGRISGIADHGVYVTIKENYCEGLVRYDKMYAFFEADEHKFKIKSDEESYKMGDTVWVRVLGANRYKRQIDLAMLDPTTINPEDLPKLESEMVATDEPEESTVVKHIKIADPALAKKKKVQKVEKPVQNKAYELLLPAVQKAFNESDIKTVANKRKMKWNYELAPNAPVQHSILLLHFNPLAVKNKGYRQQKLLSNHAYKPQGSTMGFFQSYFPEETVSQGYLSPFRSMDEKQLSDKDIELSLSTFKAFIDLLKPKSIVSFSNHLLDILLSLKLLSELEEEEIGFEYTEEDNIKAKRKRTLITSKGILTINDRRIPIAFVPNPSSRIAKALKKNAWDWALTAE